MEVTMGVFHDEMLALGSWPARERIEVLKRIVSKKTVEAILRDRRADRGRRPWRLPQWFVVWFVIGIGLFSRDSYRQVYRWLGPFGKTGTPCRSALCEARKRLGVGVIRTLAQNVITLLGKPDTPGAFYASMRLMAVDGFVVDLPDTEKNERAFGRPRNGRAEGAFPQARILSLCETGSHVLWRSLIKPIRRGEIPMARTLLQCLEASMLLLWDRNFLSYDLVQTVLDRTANLLARVKKNLIFEPIKQLPDGSYLAKLYSDKTARRHDRNGIVVRIIDYKIGDTTRDANGELHRLLTNLLDHEQHPAEQLIVLYHERWEEEIAIDELKTHQRERPVLRSQTPGGVVQELYGYLISHYLIRTLIQHAANEQGVDPDRISFTNTLKILRCRLPECPQSQVGMKRWLGRLLAEIGEEILPPRRDRINPRVIKKKMSNWPKKRKKHLRPPKPQQPFAEAIQVLI